jgi:hypothetical protein
MYILIIIQMQITSCSNSQCYMLGDSGSGWSFRIVNIADCEIKKMQWYKRVVVETKCFYQAWKHVYVKIW